MYFQEAFLMNFSFFISYCIECPNLSEVSPQSSTGVGSNAGCCKAAMPLPSINLNDWHRYSNLLVALAPALPTRTPFSIPHFGIYQAAGQYLTGWDLAVQVICPLTLSSGGKTKQMQILMQIIQVAKKNSNNTCNNNGYL